MEPVQWSLRWPTESSFGGIFAKWSDLTISDHSLSSSIDSQLYQPTTRLPLPPPCQGCKAARGTDAGFIDLGAGRLYRSLPSRIPQRHPCNAYGEERQHRQNQHRACDGIFHGGSKGRGSPRDGTIRFPSVQVRTQLQACPSHRHSPL